MRRYRIIFSLLTVIWIVLIILMYADYVQNPPIGDRIGNEEGSFLKFSLLSLIELIVLAVLVFINKYLSRFVAIAMTLASIALSIFFLLNSMHSGGIAVLHFFWLCLLTVTLSLSKIAFRSTAD